MLTEKVKKHKYYYGSEVYGEIYDWKAIFKLYRSLKIPDTCWTVPEEALDSKYVIGLSARSVAKTTNVLLLGLCQRALYDTEVVYIRASDGEFTPSESKKLVEVLNTYEHGRYIKQLTNNKYNSIIYKNRAFFYAYRDEDGDIIEKEEQECIKVCTVDRWIDYKSTLNLPKGDFILFDEFIRDHYDMDEFVHFCDLFKTIARDRMSPVIFMTANTISTTSPYYSELEIKPYLRKMKSGEKLHIVTEEGTKLYVEMIQLKKKAQEKRSFFKS